MELSSSTYGTAEFQYWNSRVPPLEFSGTRGQMPLDGYSYWIVGSLIASKKMVFYRMSGLRSESVDLFK